MTQKALSINQCPRFISCITPCFYGKSEYHYILHTCLTPEWVNCLEALTWHNHQSALFPDIRYKYSFDKEIINEVKVPDEDPAPCSRLEICMQKDNGKAAPIEEYQKAACSNEKHIYCLWYYIWDRSGRDPSDPMDNPAIHGDPVEETVMKKILGGFHAQS